MNIVFLFIGCVFLMLICWLLFKDFFSPASIICEVFTASSFFAIFSAQKMNIDISIETVIFIIAQLAIGIFVAMLLKVGHRQRTIINNEDISILSINKNNYNILLLIVTVLTLVYGYFYLKEIMAFSGETFIKRLFSFRQDSVTEGNSNVPALIQYFSKVIYAFAYFSIYIYIHDFLVIKKIGSKKKSSKVYLVSVGLLIFTALITGARAELIYFIVFVIVVYALIKNKLYARNFSIKKLIKLSAIGLGVLLIFYITAALVGRGSDGFINSVSGYLGAPIVAFDRYFVNFDNNFLHSGVWGKESFYSVVHLLDKLGFINSNIGSVHLDYVYINGQIFTNVYTAFRSYITDFGVLGSFFVHAICVLFYEQFYYKCDGKICKLDDVNIDIIIYGLISYGLFLYFYSNYFYALIISLHTLIQIICIYLFKRFTMCTRKRRYIP